MNRSGTQRDPTPWTEQELSTLQRLRESGLKFRQIAPHLPGRTWQQCARRYSYMMNGAVYNERRKFVRIKQISKSGRPLGTIAGGDPSLDENTIAQKVKLLAAYDARNLTAAIFGDPPKGFSALDLRERANA